MTNISLENYHLQWIYPFCLQYFDSYVSLPEGNLSAADLAMLMASNIPGDATGCAHVTEFDMDNPGISEPYFLRFKRENDDSLVVQQSYGRSQIVNRCPLVN